MRGCLFGKGHFSVPAKRRLCQKRCLLGRPGGHIFCLKLLKLFSTPEESLTQICDFARISLFARSKQFVYQGPGVGVLGQPPGDVVEGEAEVQLCEADGAGHGGRRRTSPLQEEGGDDAVLVHVAQLTEVHQAPLLVDSAQGEDDDHSWRGVGKDCSSGARVD